MTLENIVPSLEACKRIPQGAFADSALVWLPASEKIAHVFARDQIAVYSENTLKMCIPAPTLAEILAEINAMPYPAADYVQLRAEPDGKWKVHNGVKGSWDVNPATAALLLWLELKGVQG